MSVLKCSELKLKVNTQYIHLKTPLTGTLAKFLSSVFFPPLLHAYIRACSLTASDFWAELALD